MFVGRVNTYVSSDHFTRRPLESQCKCSLWWTCFGQLMSDGQSDASFAVVGKGNVSVSAILIPLALCLVQPLCSVNRKTRLCLRRCHVSLLSMLLCLWVVSGSSSTSVPSTYRSLRPLTGKLSCKFPFRCQHTCVVSLLACRTTGTCPLGNLMQQDGHIEFQRVF